MSKHAKSSNGSFHPLSAPDFLPLRQLRDLQLQRLQAIVRRAYDSRGPVPQTHGRARSRTPQEVRTLDDIAKLPFAEKTDLRDTYPFGLFASPDEGYRAPARLDRHHRASRLLSPTRKRTCAGLDQRDAAQPSRRAACTRATSFRTRTATACSRAGWARITARRRSAQPSFPISGGNTPAPVDGDEGFWRHGDLLHARATSST